MAVDGLIDIKIHDADVSTFSAVATMAQWRKSSNGNVFLVTGPLCGEFTGHHWIPLTKASDAELDVFFHMHLNKRLSKQS